MKRLNIYSTVVILFIFLFQGFSYSQSKFEGKIQMKITEEGQSHEMTYFVKDNKFRMEFNEQGHSGAMIFDPVNKKMIMIMNEQKMYMEIPTDKEMEKEMNENEGEVKFTKTGVTKTINGYKCEKWLYKSNDEQGEAWMTKKLGSFTLLTGQSMRSAESKPEWMKEIEKENAFPMLVKIKDKNGNETGQLEVTSVKKESLKSSLFEVPSGFKKFNMPMNKQH